MASKNSILIYVQAVPKTSTNPKRFQDLMNSEFVLAYSSKMAISKAQKFFPESEVTAAGYSKVLPETIARGAHRVISLPFCDDPIEQAKSFPAFDNFDLAIVAENLEGPFTGASLCGALAALRKLDFEIADEPSSFRHRLILLRDGESFPFEIDVRKINAAFNQEITPSEVRGDSILEKKEPRSSPEFTSGSAAEIAGTFSRRLRRIVPA
jgi:hypothetical protein